MSKVRFVASSTVVVLIATALLLIPLPNWVDVPMILQGHEATTLYTQESGILEAIYYKDNDPMNSGIQVATLHNVELSREMASLEAQIAGHQDSLKKSEGVDELRAQQEKMAMEAAKENMEALRNRMRRLTIEVPPNVSGVLLTPPREEELGKAFKQGDVFCSIGNPKDLEAFLVYPHTDISLIKVGQAVTLKLNGHLGSVINGTIDRISSDALDQLPPGLSNKNGGEVPTKPTQTQRPQEMPITRAYSVIVRIPNEDGTWRPGLRGCARIHIEPACLGWRLWRYALQTLNFKL